MFVLVVRKIGNTVSGRQYFMNTCCLARYSAADVIDEVRLDSDDVGASSTNLRVPLLGAYLRTVFRRRKQEYFLS